MSEPTSRAFERRYFSLEPGVSLLVADQCVLIDINRKTMSIKLPDVEGWHLLSDEQLGHLFRQALAFALEACPFWLRARHVEDTETPDWLRARYAAAVAAGSIDGAEVSHVTPTEAAGSAAHPEPAAGPAFARGRDLNDEAAEARRLAGCE